MAIKLADSKFYAFDRLTAVIRGTSEMAQMVMNSVNVEVDLNENEQEIPSLAGVMRPEQYAVDKVMTDFKPTNIWTWSMEYLKSYSQNRGHGTKKYATNVGIRFYFMSNEDRADFISHLTKEKLIQG